MEFEAELTEKFYNLPGSTVEEKKKSLNVFISELNNKVPQRTIKNAFITNLKPKNKLETVFQIDLLLHYQIYDVVLELLKSGNLLYISKILKDWKFFKEAFQDMSGSTFVNDVLSHTSFAARTKIINRVSKNVFSEKRANEFFEAIEEKYGIFSAEIMLSSCSSDVIKAKIHKYNLLLTHRQLIAILKRNNEFLEFYYDYLYNNYRLSNCNHIALSKVIFKRNEALFWYLCEKYSININFGARLSKKLLKEKKHLLKDISNCRVRFNKRQIYQQLRKYPDVFKKFVLQRTSHDMTDFCNNYTSYSTEIGTSIYRFVSKNRRYQFLNNFFKEKFNYNLHDEPEVVTEDVFRFMPEEFRENILTAKIKEDDTLAYLLRPTISVPFIMDKIKHCSDMQKRVTYVSMLYRTCEFYKDEEYLLETLKYIETRHRNDINALEKIFRRLPSWPDIENLSADHWTYIDRIQKLLNLKNINFRESFFLAKRIGHLLNNNKDVSEQMQNYLELITKSACYIDEIFTEIPKYRKSCILEMKKYVDKIEDKDVLANLSTRYLSWILAYNKTTSSKDDIPILNYLPLIRSLLEKKGMSGVICTFYVRLYYEQFNPIIWEYKHFLLDSNSLFSWYILNHKDELLNKIESIYEFYCVKTNKKFIRYLSLCSFRNIPDSLTKFCIKIIQSEEHTRHKLNQLTVLSLVNQEEFFRLSQSFDPSVDGKINVDDPPEGIQLIENILMNLKHYDMPVELLQVLSKFCIGDYLKYALQPLYNISSHVPEEHVIPFVKKLHNSAVSVRKHAIHLSKFIFPVEKFCEFIMEESISESNASIKSILFQKALEYAARMPTSRTWELIKATMHGIDKNDVEAHDLLLNIEEIPEEHRAEYIPEAYTQLKSNTLPEIRRKRFNLIHDIPVEVIDQLDCDLMQTFMTELIFNENIGSACDVWTNFVFHTTGEKQNVLFEFALSKLHDYNKLHSNDTIDNKQLGFMNKFCDGVVEFLPSYTMVNKFSTMWFSVFAPEIDINTHYFVTFILTYAECKYDIKVFAMKTNELLKSFLINYGDCLFELFESNLKKFFANIGYLNICEFVESLLADRDCVPACLLSIHLLSLREPVYKEEIMRYSFIIQKLKAKPELSIKIYFRKYLRDFEQKLNKKIES